MRGPVKNSGEPATKANAKPAGAKKPASQDSNAAATTAVIIGIVLLAAAGGTWFMLNRGSSSRPASTAGTTSIETGPGAATAGASGGRNTPATPGPAAAPQVDAATPATAVSSAEAELSRGRELFASQQYVAAAAAFDRVQRLLGQEPSPQLEEMRQVARSMAEVSRAAIAEMVEAATREYRSGDEGVVEPVALGYLPPKPDPATPAEQLQVLEVHINTSGTVDTAKFVMNRPSFRNTWWTSAAKAWRFSPAMRNGQPVRYVMRIVMDDSAAR